MNEKHQFIIPAVIFTVVVSIIGGFFVTQAQTAWLRPASVAQPSLKADGDAEISGSLNTTGGAILNTAGAATGLIVAYGNVGIGTTTPGTKLDVAGFFKVEPPSSLKIYNYTGELPLQQPWWSFYGGRCSWDVTDDAWDTVPLSVSIADSSKSQCIDVNGSKASEKCVDGGSSGDYNRCYCDANGNSNECVLIFGACDGVAAVAEPFSGTYPSNANGVCEDRYSGGSLSQDYYIKPYVRSYGIYTPVGQVCIGGDCRSGWPSAGGSGTVTSVATGAGLIGGPITTSGTISINSPTCTTSQKLLWNGSAFVCDTDQTGGAGSDGLGTGNSGTAGYITKWTGSNSIRDSIIQDDGTSIGIGSVPPSGYKLNAEGVSGRSGVRGASTGGGYGVTGTTDTGIGVYGVSSSGSGVYGDAASTIAVGVRGRNSALGGFAGYFDGDVAVTGKIKMRVDTVAYQATGPNTPGFYKITSGSGPTCTSTERGSMFIGRVSPQSTQDALCVCIDVDSAMNYWCLNP